MSSVVISGDTSGSITLAAPAVAGSNTLTLPANTGTVITTASTFAGTGPAFSAYPSTTTTLTANTDVKVTFDTELFDTNNCFASSRFTPNVAGYYQVNLCLSVNFWNGTIFSALIYKNGSAYQYGQTAYPQTVGGVRASISTIVYLNGTTDYIEAYGYQYAQTSNNVVAASQVSTWFNAALVRAA